MYHHTCLFVRTSFCISHFAVHNNYTCTHMHARTHARTHSRKHARTYVGAHMYVVRAHTYVVRTIKQINKHIQLHTPSEQLRTMTRVQTWCTCSLATTLARAHTNRRNRARTRKHARAHPRTRTHTHTHTDHWHTHTFTHGHGCYTPASGPSRACDWWRHLTDPPISAGRRHKCAATIDNKN